VRPNRLPTKPVEHETQPDLKDMLPAFSWKNMTTGLRAVCPGTHSFGHMNQACSLTPSAAVIHTSSYSMLNSSGR
jgi:hypothetical protein